MAESQHDETPASATADPSELSDAAPDGVEPDPAVAREARLPNVAHHQVVLDGQRREDAPRLGGQQQLFGPQVGWLSGDVFPVEGDGATGRLQQTGQHLSQC